MSAEIVIIGILTLVALLAVAVIAGTGGVVPDVLILFVTLGAGYWFGVQRGVARTRERQSASGE